MDFHEAANFCLELRRFPPRRETDATEALLAELGDPHEDLQAVQIAGSNGKGSTARMLESTLREAGLSVGLYTSPHLEDVRERITVDGRKIPKAALVEFVERIEPYVTERAAEGEAPTFFETMTVLALWQFARADVDVAVLEVGIGGRYDATSVVDPVASAVTSVTLEHTDLLGETVEEIARDKAHVAPADAPIVTGATGSAREAIGSVAGEVVTVDESAADTTVAYHGIEGTDGRVELDGDGFHVETRLPLPGAHQARNAGVAATLARQVADVDETTLATGLRNAHWPGRFEVMGREPLVVLDGAHNPGGCERVTETLEAFEYDDLHLVVGAMVGKDHQGIAAALPEPEHVVACQADVDRADDETVIAAAFESEYPEATVETRSDVAGALDIALDAAEESDAVLVSGSLYAVREARTRWTRATIEKRIEDLDDARETLAGAHVTDAGVWRMRGKGVHRAVKTRVQPRQAQYLKEELLSLGGECAISGLNNQDEEPLDVVMMATMAQFKRLVGKLDGQPYGLSPLADRLREHLGIGVEPDRRGYPWEDRTAIMGVLNVTPDSFHDGGEYDAVEDAVARAETMVDNGVDIVDVGGESTRPGAEPVPAEEEIDRVVPVIERIAELDVAVSIDTRKAVVAAAALEAGADILNDVSGLEDPEMRHLAAEHDVPVVVMHSIDTPVDPDREIEYDDVVEDALDQLKERVLLAEKAGLDRAQILVDPGVGFGKTPAEDFELLGRIGEFKALGCPVLVGHSHKSMFGHVGLEADERMAATIAGTALATERGVDVIRVHDVEENVAARDVVAAADDPDAFANE
ncbi:dihydropteroate synthase [Halapricum desulfuricans]|uniref:Probable bifunctional folylpolyglutamate synthase/dihydropteroate synthase n=1 Tax=Halapricum desulfuricans TaxID=2841257 RepID=A0A897NCQ2_9EURY|nr:dihydropteroate synthase [Halapricum desulfuricans]QSG10258.1 Folylpolyglutamate synthase and Dihydropteroate synthase [Halapricum desulfuricans]